MKGFLSFAVGLILLRIFLPELAGSIIELLFQVIQKISELLNTGLSFSPPV
jgi:hypothetical protein